MRLALLGIAVIAAWSSAVMAATCTITNAHVLVKEGGLDVSVPGLIGYAIPVAITESTGAFAVDFSNVPVAEFTIVVDNSISLMSLGTVTGTIDASGNVALPPVVIDFNTALTPDTLHATEAFRTGLEAVSSAGTDYVTMGSSLDFQTGALRLEAIGIVPNAPVVGVSTTAQTIACTLDPIPAQANLPKGPTLTLHGSAKPGKSGSTATVVGDTLAIKAKMKNGPAPADLTQDLFVRIAIGDAEVLLVRVPAGSLTKKGKKFTASDSDGSVVHVISGRKSDGSSNAALAGSVAVVQTKKGLTLTLKESGIDSAPLAAGGSATATVSIGSVIASDAVTLKSSAKKTVLK